MTKRQKEIIKELREEIKELNKLKIKYKRLQTIIHNQGMRIMSFERKDTHLHSEVKSE